jgi:hypothetical protein
MGLNEFSGDIAAACGLIDAFRMGETLKKEEAHP